MQKDAQTYVKACNNCQKFSNIIRQPTEELTPMTARGRLLNGDYTSWAHSR